MHENELWKNALATLEVEVSKANFAAFLSKTKLTSLTEKKTVITCPSSLIAERLKKRYAKMIESALGDLTGKDRQLVFEVCRNHSPPSKTEDLGPLFTQPKNHDGLFPSYTFDNFVVGLSNRLAHTAALAVTHKPGTLHNPLLLYAGVGLGKTHLLHAIGNDIKSKNLEAKIRYCPAESFTNEMIEAIQNQKTTAQFKKGFRSIDLLLVDDIQFLAGREATQEEFFNTFNELYLSGKQVVLTSDRHPQEIKELEARLVSRFSGGMVADIQPPDLDLRIAILRQKAKEQGITLNEEIIFALAEQVAGSIRQLEGTLTQLLLLSQMHHETSPKELVNLVIRNDAHCQTPAVVPPETTLKEICRQFKISKEEITGRRRTKEINRPRQIAMYLLRETTSLSLEKIGELLGGRDHSTVLYGLETIEGKMRNDPLLQNQINVLEKVLHQSGKTKILSGKLGS